MGSEVSSSLFKEEISLASVPYFTHLQTVKGGRVGVGVVEGRIHATEGNIESSRGCFPAEVARFTIPVLIIPSGATCRRNNGVIEEKITSFYLRGGVSRTETYGKCLQAIFPDSEECRLLGCYVVLLL
jgi:hypothetical protein